MGLDIAPTIDTAQPDEYWQRYMYFNAGWFFGASAPAFGRRFLDTACTIRDRTPAQVVIQELYPWLDQIALPLVIHALGGGRPSAALAGLDGDVTCHYRLLSLLYARESDRVVEVLETVANRPDLRPILRDYEPVKMMVYQNKGRKARALFDRLRFGPSSEDLDRARQGAAYVAQHHTWAQRLELVTGTAGL
jgi:hypothetical protein